LNSSFLKTRPALRSQLKPKRQRSAEREMPWKFWTA